MKRKLNDLSAEERKYTKEILFKAAKDAHDKGTTQEFLEGLLTPSEQIMLGRRIWIARLLIEDESQAHIGKLLKVGPNTIWRVEKWLQGQLPDYEKILQEAEKEQLHKNRIRTAKEKPFGLTALKLKYPMHFLLFPWPKK